MAWILVVPGLALQFLSFQKLWIERHGPAAARALWTGQAGWVLMALGLSIHSPAARLGAVNLLFQAVVLTWPLSVLLKNPARQVGLFTLLALGQAGCIPFSGFPAYFQAFSPLMGVNQNVGSMGEKLFTYQALLGTVVIFSLLCQTAALGASLLRRLELPDDPRSAVRWPWLNVVVSLTLGLQAGRAAQFLARFLSW